MTDKKSFILYDSYYEAIRILSDENRGKLLLALFEYEIEGKEPEALPSDAAVAFFFIRSNLDRDCVHYKEKCEKSRNSANSGYNKNKKPEHESESDEESQREEAHAETEPGKTAEDSENKYYGCMKNVRLSEEEYGRFCSMYPKDSAKRIDRLSLFMASNGRTYENHFATLCKWAQEDEEKKKPEVTGWENSPPSYDLEKAERDSLIKVPTLRKRPG